MGAIHVRVECKFLAQPYTEHQLIDAVADLLGKKD